ncbi:Cloroperoxidase [Sistotremastrum suecicum HHB10207 ss-3]|uniref:Cloroperoxidase n=1 Tax=Sistotremastrum suecicum HHB10207 ss-3 TaxID=1314776 RepID=A0A166GJI9_9AGAM|nr:Cloroperoxidase [Sistotremastrum suecicum HHB10207 ss-3]
MRLIGTFCALAIFVQSVVAFPSFLHNRDIDLSHLSREIDSVLARVPAEDLAKLRRDASLQKRSTFSESQLIDVSGVHAYAPPTAGQTRGPCPGLNVLANHGYFDRSGVVTFTQSVSALTSVLNLGIDTAIALVTYSIAIIGDPIALTWSIGGSYPSSIPLILPRPGGIDASHNNYESDASVTRGDSYLHNGDVWSVQLATFKKLYALQDGPDADYTKDVLIQHRKNTFDYSVQNNPHFFFAPFSGLVVATAAHNFVAYFFANHSAEKPDGYLDQKNLKSFFGITGDTIDTLVYNYGTERIPDNWYKAPNPYSLVDVVTEILESIQANPEVGAIGGNTGTVNSFVGVNLGDLTGGVINSQNLLQGNNIFCFAWAAARAGLPTALSGVTSLLGNVLNLLDTKLAPYLPALACPAIDEFNLSLFNQFPGYTQH